MSSKLESDVCCRLQVAPSGESYGGNRRPAESNGSLLPGLWRDSLHVTCGLTACTVGSAPGPTLCNENGKTLPFLLYPFNGLFSESLVSWYQKGKTSLDLNDARDGGVSGISWTICKQSVHHASDRYPNQHLIAQFLQAGCSSWRPSPTNSECHSTEGSVSRNKIK